MILTTGTQSLVWILRFQHIFNATFSAITRSKRISLHFPMELDRRPPHFLRGSHFSARNLMGHSGVTPYSFSTKGTSFSSKTSIK